MVRLRTPEFMGKVKETFGTRTSKRLDHAVRIDHLPINAKVGIEYEPNNGQLISF